MTEPAVAQTLRDALADYWPRALPPPSNPTPQLTMNDKERNYFMGEVCKIFALNLPETVQTQRLNGVFDQIYALGQQTPTTFAGGVKRRRKDA